MKKKIFLLITIIVSAFLIFTNTEEKEVKAQTCETYYNYYLLLDATNSNTFLNGGDNGTTNLTCSDNTCTRTDAKYFKLPVPEDATNKESGLVTLYQSLSDETYDKWGYETFYNYYKQLDDIGDDYIVLLDATGGTKKYIASSIPWTNNSGVELSTHTNIGTFVEFQNASILNNATIVVHGNVSSDSEDFYNIKIQRTWNESQMQAIQTIYNQHGSVTIWSPAVYYVKYELCEEEEETPTYNVTVDYYDKDTNQKLTTTTTIESNLEDGDTYSYTCPANKFNNYLLYEDDLTNYPIVHSGTISSSDVNLECYYVESDEPLYKVTANYYLDGTTTKVRNSAIINTNLSDGTSYNYSCPSISNYTLLTTTMQTGTINGNDGVVNCYYKEQEKTYTLTVNYGTDEDCTGEPVKKTETYTLKENDTKTIEFESKIGSLSNPALGTYSSQFTTKPTVKSNKLSVVMPANDVSICIVYTPQTGISWIYFAWIVAICALGYSAWYFVQYYKAKKNNV